MRIAIRVIKFRLMNDGRKKTFKMEKNRKKKVLSFLKFATSEIIRPINIKGTLKMPLFFIVKFCWGSGVIV